MARILIVDDAMFMRTMLRGIIEKAGHTVVAEGANGREALEQYKKTKPDLVTLDITMPEVDGITAAGHIMEFDPEAKIIMCSAMGQQSMVIDALRAGAKDFIVKPFNGERVLGALQNQLEL